MPIFPGLPRAPPSEYSIIVIKNSKIRKVLCVQKFVDSIHFIPVNNSMEANNFADFLKQSQDKTRNYFTPNYLDEQKTNYISNLLAENTVRTVKLVRNLLFLQSTCLSQEEREEFNQGTGVFALEQARNFLDVLKDKDSYTTNYAWETFLQSKALLQHLYTNEADVENTSYDQENSQRFHEISGERTYVENWFKKAYNNITESYKLHTNNPSEYWVKANWIIDQVNNVLTLELESPQFLDISNNETHKKYVSTLTSELIQFAFSTLYKILDEQDNPDFKYTLQNINFEKLLQTNQGYKQLHTLYNRSFNPDKILLQITHEENFVDAVIIPLLTHENSYDLLTENPLHENSIFTRFIKKYVNYIFDNVNQESINGASQFQQVMKSFTLICEQIDLTLPVKQIEAYIQIFSGAYCNNKPYDRELRNETRVFDYTEIEIAEKVISNLIENEQISGEIKIQLFQLADSLSIGYVVDSDIMIQVLRKLNFTTKLGMIVKYRKYDWMPQIFS